MTVYPLVDAFGFLRRHLTRALGVGRRLFALRVDSDEFCECSEAEEGHPVTDRAHLVLPASYCHGDEQTTWIWLQCDLCEDDQLSCSFMLQQIVLVTVCYTRCHIVQEIS